MKKQKKRVPLLIALKEILEKTSDYTGKLFFDALVKNLSEVLNVYAVWVTEYLPENNRLNALAFIMDNKMVEHYEYDVPGTPCEPVIKNKGICHVPENVIQLFPNDPDIKNQGAVSYMGLALKDTDGSVMGHLALLDNKPMEAIPEVFAVFEIFASRAAAEMRRINFENKLAESEAKLNRLVNGTMDAIIELDKDGIIVQYNTAAIKAFDVHEKNFIGKPIKQFLNESSYTKITGLIPHLNISGNNQNALWVQGHLTCITAKNKTFPADASISLYQSNGVDYYALYIRNVKDRFDDQEVIKKLNVETTMLKEKISASQFEEIIGESAAMLKSLELVNQVAQTNSTVLILGETGTGKELFARATHNASKRKEKPLVTLNCAALPTDLIESELFGHIKGAFTGANTTRQGRFALADGGTLFLDEIGELPLTLQAKLLRVIQEGEFQPVGSSKTLKVDVRIIAATHRNLAHEVETGKFREDLFYRLNVFPIYVPPLRDRNQDILILAEAFLHKYAKTVNKTLQLNDNDKKQLVNYDWPGNVRELQNIIERAVITNKNGALNLAALLNPNKPLTTENTTNTILTDAELKLIEKNNIIAALNACNGKISGENGAALLLNIPSTTLSSKIKKLEIKPRY